MALANLSILPTPSVGPPAGLRDPADDPLERLTDREVEVSLLIADGLSNDEAAERLHVTRRTVEFHLTNAYRKLGVRGRAALAAAVARELTGLGGETT
jgi:DNA-binding CsgD family transcriptional regulator